MMNYLRSVAFLLTLGLASASWAQDKKLLPITVAYSATSGTFYPIWVAVDQGVFAKQGLNIRMTYIQGIRVQQSALTAGEIQVYQVAAEGLIRLMSGAGD